VKRKNRDLVWAVVFAAAFCALMVALGQVVVWVGGG